MTSLLTLSRAARLVGVTRGALQKRITKAGVTLLVDPMSFQYLIGAEIDFQENIQGAQFVIKNPNAKTTCGCGSSFSA